MVLSIMIFSKDFIKIFHSRKYMEMIIFVYFHKFTNDSNRTVIDISSYIVRNSYQKFCR